jgi:hypothetical protein
MLPFPCTPSPNGKGAKTVKSVRDAPGLKCQECPRLFMRGIGLLLRHDLTGAARSSLFAPALGDLSLGR